MLSTTHLISIVFTLVAVTVLGICSINLVKSSDDFIVGGRSAGSWLVIGTMAGTLLGGSSTIGTAQLAYSYGFSAWWFTLGAGISCIIMGLFFAKPLRESEAATGPGFLAEVYGRPAKALACSFSSVGIFINIIAQVLAAVALITSIVSLNPMYAAFFSVILIVLYVIFGGFWGAGLVGTLKLALLYFSMCVAGILAYKLGGGTVAFKQALPAFPYFSLFGRGLGKDLAAGFSLLVGIFSTQTYLQAMFSGKDARSSRNGAIISGLMIIPMGLAGIAVGLYMKAYYVPINSQQALPLFVISFLPDWIGGIVLATLLISIVGTAAGLILGISTMLSQDIYKEYINPNASDQTILFISRATIIIIAALSLVFVSQNMNSLILKWSFLSMGLRGATICFPLVAAILFPGFVKAKAGLIAIGLAPACTIGWAILGNDAIDPLYVGLLASLVVLILGSMCSAKSSHELGGS